jgi:hypothetical protein
MDSINTCTKDRTHARFLNPEPFSLSRRLCLYHDALQHNSTVNEPHTTMLSKDAFKVTRVGLER